MICIQQGLKSESPLLQSGLSLDGQRNLVIADRTGHSIRIFHKKSRTVNTLAGSGSADYGYRDGPASSALFKNPMGLALGTAWGEKYGEVVRMGPLVEPRRSFRIIHPPLSEYTTEVDHHDLHVKVFVSRVALGSLSLCPILWFAFGILARAASAGAPRPGGGVAVDWVRGSLYGCDVLSKIKDRPGCRSDRGGGTCSDTGAGAGSGRCGV
eukprot:1317311-Amorphochlora_amoeboformis.AAC.1